MNQQQLIKFIEETSGFKKDNPNFTGVIMYNQDTFNDLCGKENIENLLNSIAIEKHKKYADSLQFPDYE